MKQVRIGHTAFSKVICGSNPFYGRSHFSEARDAEYRNRFDAQRIERAIRCYLDRGGNTVESTANERVVAILTRLRDRVTGSVHFVGTARSDETSDLKSHVEKLF